MSYIPFILFPLEPTSCQPEEMVVKSWSGRPGGEKRCSSTGAASLLGPCQTFEPGQHCASLPSPR